MSYLIYLHLYFELLRPLRCLTILLVNDSVATMEDLNNNTETELVNVMVVPDDNLEKIRIVIYRIVL